MKEKKRRLGFENYDKVDIPDFVTFGTTLFMRKDKKALKIVFPTGQICTFEPEAEQLIADFQEAIKKI